MVNVKRTLKGLRGLFSYGLNAVLIWWLECARIPWDWASLPVTDKLQFEMGPDCKGCENTVQLGGLF